LKDHRPGRADDDLGTPDLGDPAEVFLIELFRI